MSTRAADDFDFIRGRLSEIVKERYPLRAVEPSSPPDGTANVKCPECAWWHGYHAPGCSKRYPMPPYDDCLPVHSV